MDAAPFHLRLPAALDEVAALQDAIEAWSGAQGIPQAVATRLQLVAEEVAANVAMHGHGATFFELTVTAAPTELRLALLDDGPAYDPLAQAAPDTAASLEQRDAGGLGIHLIRTLARDVRHERLEGRNRLTCTLSLAAQPAEGE